MVQPRNDPVQFVRSQSQETSAYMKDGLGDRMASVQVDLLQIFWRRRGKGLSSFSGANAKEAQCDYKRILLRSSPAPTPDLVGS